MPSPFRKDAVTLVTGASAGIGRELARLAAPDSRRVYLVARRLERLEELAGELEAEHADLEAIPLGCDLTVREERRSLLEEVGRRGDPVDHLINNAGAGDVGRFAHQERDRQMGLLELDVVAVQDLLHAFFPGMVARGYGRVLNVASTAAFQPIPNMATYAAAKAWLLSLSEALWDEGGTRGVGVTALCPGRTETEFFEAARGFGEIVFDQVPASDAVRVARDGYEGMRRGKRRVIPGLTNKLNPAVRFLPRSLVLPIARRLFER